MGTQPLPTDPRTSAGWIRRDVFESITVDADRVADGTMTLEQFTDRLGWHLTIVDDPHADQDETPTTVCPQCERSDDCVCELGIV